MKILIIGYTYTDKDSRIKRQINWLWKNHELSLISFGYSNPENITLVKTENAFPFYKKVLGFFLLKFKLYMAYYYSLKEISQAAGYLKERDFDLIICNDIQSLPVAVKYRKNAKIYFDAHEFTPKEHDSSLFWRICFEDYYYYLCKKFIPEADEMTTVCQKIADEYGKIYKKNVKILMNLPEFYALEAPEYNEKPVFHYVHHGVSLPQRKLEVMISIFQKLGKNYQLDLYLVPTNQSYHDSLLKMCSLLDNVHLKEEVNMGDLLPVLTHYDAGIFILPSDSFNYQYALPNKLFDFIQARLAVVIGPSYEMKRIIDQYQCGYVTKDFDEDHIVDEIRKISKDQINQYKENSHKASAVLNNEKSKIVFDSIIKSLTKH